MNTITLVFSAPTKTSIGTVIAAFVVCAPMAFFLFACIRKFARDTRFVTGKSVDPKEREMDLAWYAMMFVMLVFTCAMPIAALVSYMRGES